MPAAATTRESWGPQDLTRLSEALALAAAGFGLTEPNPRVGCVIGREDGTVLGRGHTQQAGGPHAEIMALRDAASQGHEVRGATAWVTLEPCAHHGRTPPCCDALVAAGIARVVLAAHDPFPQVDGQGTQRLRAAGIAVVEADRLALAPDAHGLHAEAAQQLRALARDAQAINIGFFSRLRRGRPWVRMKVAASLDGRTALPDGRSQWITDSAARHDGHAWRRRASAVLTGIGTVLEDDPRLDVRHVPTALQPWRVVVDSALQTPPQARLLNPPDRGVWIYGARDEDGRADRLRQAGADVQLLPDAHGKVDLHALLQDLARRGVNELHVEAGHKLNGSLLRAGLVDELLLYLAPTLLGPGRELAVLPPRAELPAQPEFDFVECAPVGRDLRLRAQRAEAWAQATGGG
jgi:diaminohydroxyphosphoribosylaminopyrimidine deaminase/5-amino-6-(5-phosphoribosylamino)uracil reductase